MKLKRLTIALFMTGNVVSCSEYVQATDDTHQQINDTMAQHAKPQGPGAAKKKKLNLPESVRQMLATSDQPVQSTAETFSISANDMSAKEFFAKLAHMTNTNIVTGGDMTDMNVTLNLEDATLPEILKVAERIYGFDVDHFGNTITIMPTGYKTRVFKINRINVERSGTSSMTVEQAEDLSGSSSSSSSGQSSSLKSTFTDSTFWDEMSASIKMLIESGDKSGGSITVNKGTGMVVVRAKPKQLDQVAAFIDHVQAAMNKQVVIETEFLEVDLDKSLETILTLDAKKWAMSDSNVFTYDSAGAGSTFAGMVKMLSENGKVAVISSPRVSTLNNQKAIIKVGTDQYYVTGTSTSTTPVGSTTEQTSDIDLEPFFSGISLDVTPQISNDHSVMLHVHPVISDVTQQDLSVELSTTQSLSLPTAATKIRETDSLVKAKSGQMVIIGGLKLKKSNYTHKSLPGLEDLAHDRDDSDSDTELVILLKPRVVGDTDWTSMMHKWAGEFSDVPQTHALKSNQDES